MTPSPASDRAARTDVVAGPDRSWSVELPAVPESLDTVQDLVAEMYDSVEDDLHAMDRIRFETAVVEVVGNVIEHAQPADGDAPVRMEVAVSRHGRELHGVVSDTGRPSEVDLSGSQMSAPDDVNGRGLAMALALSSELRYERAGDRNRWFVTCVCA